MHGAAENSIEQTRRGTLRRLREMDLGRVIVAGSVGTAAAIKLSQRARSPWERRNEPKAASVKFARDGNDLLSLSLLPRPSTSRREARRTRSRLLDSPRDRRFAHHSIVTARCAAFARHVTHDPIYRIDVSHNRILTGASERKQSTKVAGRARSLSGGERPRSDTIVSKHAQISLAARSATTLA